jgi:hypothetical protein
MALKMWHPIKFVQAQPNKLSLPVVVICAIPAYLAGVCCAFAMLVLAIQVFLALNVISGSELGAMFLFLLVLFVAQGYIPLLLPPVIFLVGFPQVLLWAGEERNLWKRYGKVLIGAVGVTVGTIVAGVFVFFSAHLIVIPTLIPLAVDMFGGFLGKWALLFGFSNVDRELSLLREHARQYHIEHAPPNL